MRAGALRHRITIQRRVETQGTTGEVAWTWSDVADVYAAIEPISGREFFAAGQMQAPVDVRVRVRYRTGITEKMRVVFIREWESPRRVDYFDIVAVLNRGMQDRELHLMCKARSAEGFAFDGS